MPVCQRAEIRMSRQVYGEPHRLRGSITASTCVPTIGIKSDQMPGTNVIAIVTLRGVASRQPKISEVTCRTRIVTRTICAARGEVLMVPNDRMRDRFHTSPAWVIGLQKGLIASAFVLNIPQRQDSCKIGIHQKIRGVFLPAGT